MVNIQGSNEIENTLKREIQNKTLNSSLLFVGEPYTGKRLAALSLAKSYLGTNPLNSPYFISLGSLPREEEWKTFYELYLEKKISSSFLKNFVLYFMKKFNPQIWQIGDAKSKINLEDLNKIQEIILEEIELSLKEWEKINQAILRVYPLYAKSISINQVRALKEWAFSLKGVAKIAFIEGASSLSHSAMNALLKILEEPPENFICILGTNKKSELPATLLSRLRTFTFTPYKKEEIQESIEKTYHINNIPPNLYDFFNSSSLKERKELQSLAKDYYISLQERDFFPEKLPWKNIFSSKEGSYKNSLESFLKELLYLWKKEALNNPNKIYFFQKLNTSLNQEAEIAFLLNQSPISFLEKLYYQLKKIYIADEDF